MNIFKVSSRAIFWTWKRKKKTEICTTTYNAGYETWNEYSNMMYIAGEKCCWLLSESNGYLNECSYCCCCSPFGSSPVFSSALFLETVKLGWFVEDKTLAHILSVITTLFWPSMILCICNLILLSITSKLHYVLTN